MIEDNTETRIFMVAVMHYTASMFTISDMHTLADHVVNHSERKNLYFHIFIDSACVVFLSLLNLQVDVKYNFNKEIGFPAVTFCNLNPLNRTKLVCSRFDRERDDPLGLCQRSNVSSTDAQTIVQIRLQALLKSVSQVINKINADMFC